MADDEMSPQQEEAAMDAAREWNAKHNDLHNIFSPYYNGSRQRNLALEKWGPQLEAKIQRELTKEDGKKQIREFRPACGPDLPKRNAPDLDRE